MGKILGLRRSSSSLNPRRSDESYNEVLDSVYETARAKQALDTSSRRSKRLFDRWRKDSMHSDIEIPGEDDAFFIGSDGSRGSRSQQSSSATGPIRSSIRQVTYVLFSACLKSGHAGL